MAMLKIKKGDTVKVIAGKDKDKEGKVIAVDHKNGRVTVEGVNMLTKHTKPSMTNQNGGIVHRKDLSTFPTLCTYTKVKLQELESKWMETRRFVLQNLLVK